MNNIFENATFGKAYKTRDGRKAVYISESTIDKGAVLIVYEDSISAYRIMKDGHYWATPNIESSNDIVSEWQEPISEKELDKLCVAKKGIKYYLQSIHASCKEMFKRHLP